MNYITNTPSKTFFFGFITGIVVATVGFSGVLRIADKGVDYVRLRSAELANAELTK
jgi:hypothetical protein